MKKHLMSLTVFLTALALFPANANAGEVKEWTFLTFLNGHNNLDSFGSQNIRSMEEVGSNDKINIVVQWASMANKGTQRLLVQKSTDPTKVTSPVVEELAPVDMGDYRELLKFIEWGVAHYPAKHYFINVWDHGNGWHFQSIKLSGLSSTDDMHTSDISWDDKTGHHITTEQLGKVMSDTAKLIGHKVDIYGSDACLMAMAEVAGEMADSVEVFVGSEEVEPGAGWPYSTFLKGWNGNSEASASDVAKILTKEYLKAYSGGIYGRSSVTLSSMNLTKIENFNSAISGLSAELLRMNSAEKQKTKATAKATQDFTSSDYKDLGDFLNRLGKSTTVQSQVEAIRNAKSALENLIISNDVSPAFAGAKGVSIWLPTSSWEYNKYSQRYSGLKFSAATRWGEFLKTIN